VDGGMEPARRFVMCSLLTGAETLKPETGETLAHSKTTLQEIAQKKKLPMPRYRTVREEGPHHARTFVVEVRLGEDLVSEAKGLTKKSAEQRAAQLLLERLRDPAGEI
jgi:ribonuclease-3